MATATPAAPALSMWRPGPGRLARLLLGLTIFGAGEACLVQSDLGNSPWVVLSEGIAVHTPLAVGAATVASSFVVLALWIPLRQRPGLGTILNAILIGVAIDVALPLLPDTGTLGLRLGYVALGIALVALGSGFYLTSLLGPGPRDGLMTGLHRRTGRSLRLVRTLIEGTALLGGVVLGGTVGIGTLAFAVLIGPGVQATVGLLHTGDTREL